jgi:Spy/CpxP family protein refolding chaperone
MTQQNHFPTLRAFVVMAALGGTVLAGTVLGGTVLAAQGPGPGSMRGRGPGGPGGPGDRGAGIALRALDLTEAQREQVRQLTEQHREQTRTLAERVRTAGEAQREAMEATPFDEQNIRVTAQAFSEVQTDMAVQRARLRSDIHALLTPDQQQQLATMQAEREARQAQRQERMQQRRQGQQSR